VRDYLAKIERAYRAGNATEHTYRPDLKALLEALVPGITATNEPKWRTDCGAPDYVLTRTLGLLAFTAPYTNADEANHAPNGNISSSRASTPASRPAPPSSPTSPSARDRPTAVTDEAW
jgi:hypothetical protein